MNINAKAEMSTMKRIGLMVIAIMVAMTMCLTVMPTKVNAATKDTLSAAEYNVANPIKSFKIGKKNYAKKFKKYGTKEDAYVSKKAKKIHKKKLSIKPGKDWVIKSIYLEYAMGEGVQTKNLKNNKKFSAGKYHSIEVTLYNTETGDTVYRTLGSY